MSISRRILNEIKRTWTDRYQETNSIYITEIRLIALYIHCLSVYT